MLFAVDELTTSLAVGGSIVTPIGALVGWLVKSYFPGLIDKFLNQIDKMQNEHAVHFAEARKEFIAEVGELRKAQLAMSESLNALTNELREMKKSHPST